MLFAQITLFVLIVSFVFVQFLDCFDRNKTADEVRSNVIYLGILIFILFMCFLSGSFNRIF